MKPIPFNDLSRNSPAIVGALSAVGERVISGGWYVLGPESKQFEDEFAAFCGSSFAIGVANGSDALELALRAVGVRAGESVATVANAGGYSTHAIRAIGALPLFVDVEPDTQLINLDELASIVQSKRLKAVIVTHLFGCMVDMKRVLEICAENEIKVIEDCAQAHGASIEGKMAGSFGAAGCFSFYPTKNLGALGDGGAVITSSVALADRLRSLRQYGWKEKYHTAVLNGRNSRLDDIQASFLRVKLPLLKSWNLRRRKIAARYCELITSEQVICPPIDSYGDACVAHLFVVRCVDRERLRNHLIARNIGCQIHYPVPDHLQEAWMDTSSNVNLPVTESLASQVLSLPCYPELEDDEIAFVIRAVNEH